tara:strand:+ start:835 stop:1011 length:177 start_codon:yes stop_codon:yes gene_type:complete
MTDDLFKLDDVDQERLDWQKQHNNYWYSFYQARLLECNINDKEKMVKIYNKLGDYHDR